MGWNAADARDHPDKLGAVGRPHEGVTLRVVDEAGTDVPAGEGGRAVVQTPALAAGYAGGTDLSDRLSPDGWFRTGDVGRVDAEGFVWIEGRVSDMVNRGGLKVFPAEVEEVLRLSPGVADAAVVGVPDDRLGEVPWAFVVGTPTPPALEALCRAAPGARTRCRCGSRRSTRCPATRWARCSRPTWPAGRPPPRDAAGPLPTWSAPGPGGARGGGGLRRAVRRLAVAEVGRRRRWPP